MAPKRVVANAQQFQARATTNMFEEQEDSVMLSTEGDQKSAVVTSGMRLGTNGLAIRGVAPEHMEGCADLISRILETVSVTDDRTYRLDPDRREAFRAEVGAVCDRFPISGYPRTSG